MGFALHNRRTDVSPVYSQTVSLIYLSFHETTIPNPRGTQASGVRDLLPLLPGVSLEDRSLVT